MSKSNYIVNEILLKHAAALLETREQMRNLDSKAEFHKHSLYRELISIGQGSALIQYTPDEALFVKNNLRSTKSFDKDTLSGKVGVDRTELDYAGVSQLVEDRRLTAAEVEKFQGENQSEFVTVRKRRVKVSKK
jgi:hypothetical protein